MLGVLLAAVSLACLAAPKKVVPRHDLAGHITGLAPGHHVALHTTGAGRHTITTHTDGAFVFRNLPRGVYTVRPQDARYIFSPAFRAVSLTQDRAEVHFAARPRPQRR